MPLPFTFKASFTCQLTILSINASTLLVGLCSPEITEYLSDWTVRRHCLISHNIHANTSAWSSLTRGLFILILMSYFKFRFLFSFTSIYHVKCFKVSNFYTQRAYVFIIVIGFTKFSSCSPVDDTDSGADSKGRGGTCPHFYKWLGSGGIKTANKKLTELYWPSRKRSPKWLTAVLVKPKSGGARHKISRHQCVPPPPLLHSFHRHWIL